MIGRLLCRLGLHAWRTDEVRELPPVRPAFPRPAFINYRCNRCGKTDWTFRSE